MTTRETTGAARRWAFEQLDLSAHSPAAEVRPRVLKQLANMDFMPPGGWDSALRVSGLTAFSADADSPAIVPARRGAEELLREELEDFAAKFFSMPPDERGTRFEELAEQCAEMPALTARLAGLRPALDLPCRLPSDQPCEVAQLLDFARRLFVLPRRHRASRRLIVLKECRERPGQWPQAAEVVQRYFGRYAALDALLFRELAPSGDREELRQRVARQRRRALRKLRPPKLVTKTSSDVPRWVPVVLGVLTILYVFEDQTNKAARREQKRATDGIPDWITQQDVEFKARHGQFPDDVVRRLGLPPLNKTRPPAPGPTRPAKSDKSHDRTPSADRPAGSAPADLPALPPGAELLRELRNQQSREGPNQARDEAIRALEKRIEEAARSSKASP